MSKGKEPPQTDDAGINALAGTTPAEGPVMPAEIAVNLRKMMQRIKIKGDEAFAYSQCAAYLEQQIGLHQQAKEAAQGN